MYDSTPALSAEPKPCARKKLCADMDYEDLLILAMKREKEAFDFYNTAASMMGDKELENIFLMLAREEANHKLRFECEYDRVILKED